MKIIGLIVVMLLLGLPLYASIMYLNVPLELADSICNRLDALKGPHAVRYTEPVYSSIATVTTCILLIDERAQLVLTSEEWANRLATMPAEFLQVPPGGSQ